ncbi:acyltransferase [Chamaesiphon sp. VAR_48_metabat_135_sub]|uniref:acyltransferase family protein n=1 Tax=Chamaesiphon sp. VAR_48_metabat_135_sub TaxID=2964699 RepID=UPI00286B8998|nr:acyltransferase [Chamaesiphon sp. VAR_48_metabat_135_sub]
MNKQIGSLTALRGIAATVVVILHFAYSTLPEAGVLLSRHTRFFRDGYLFVDLFFILSGFIMTHVYLESFALGVNKFNYWSYLRARFARIYPLHLFTLAILVGLELFKLFLPNFNAFTGKFNLNALVANVFMLQAFDFHCPPLFWCKSSWNEPAWSISVEFLIYCIFPFILFALLKTKPKTDWMIFFVTLGLLLLLIRFTRGTLESIIGLPSIARCGLECVLGIITYKAYQWSKYQNNLNYNLLEIGSTIVVLGLMHKWIRSRVIFDWLTLPAFSLLILSLSSAKNGFVSKILNFPPLLYLGTISYSIYMVHWCLIEFLETFWLNEFHVKFGSNFDSNQCLLALALFTPISLVVASATYHFVEVPMRNVLNPKLQVSS